MDSNLDHLIDFYKKSKYVILDVGGEKFKIKRKILSKYPTTRLGKIMRTGSLETLLGLCDEVTVDTNTESNKSPEFYFDKNPDNFNMILDMYRLGQFHIVETGCAMVMQRDLDYWGIDELLIESCCSLKYFPQLEICTNEKLGDIQAKRAAEENLERENFGDSKMGRFRSWLWDTIEYPWTSNIAQYLAFTSLSAVVVSTLTFIISTAEELQEDEFGDTEYPTVVTIIDIIDNTVVIFFTVEFIVRIIICPFKKKFMQDPMNIIDLFAILPFFLSLLLEGLEDYEIIGKTGKIIRLIRVMRILRVFKLVRHFAGLQSIFMTLQQAYQELGLLLVLVAVAILTYSSLVYFAEKEGLESFSNINCSQWNLTAEKINNSKQIGSHPCYSWTFLESFWWGLMTITTVGYDLNPKTFLGKFVGGFCALSGVFILTLPIPIVVNSFASFYKNRLWRNEVELRKQERLRMKAAQQRQAQKQQFIELMAKTVGLDKMKSDGVGPRPENETMI